MFNPDADFQLDPPPSIRALCKDCEGWHDYFDCPAVKQ